MTKCAREVLLADVLDRILDHAVQPRNAMHVDETLHPAVLTVAALLEGNEGTCPSLGQLGGHVGLNPRYLVKIFSRQTGLPPHAYLLNSKVNLARRLIQLRYPLSEVAARSGFSDQSHMTRLFKSHFGFTPGHYARFVVAATPNLEI